MKLFIYEWVCGGGFLDRDEIASPSLSAEGAAMLSALLEDFSGIRGAAVATVVEQPLAERTLAGAILGCPRSAQERELLIDDYVRQLDATLLVAPEFEGILLNLSQRIAGQGKRLLSSSPEFVAIASDKQTTAEHLFAAKIPVPNGTVLMPGERCPAGFSYPAVVKPIDGCGSLGVKLVGEGHVLPSGEGAYRLEEYATGQPASVLCICGPNQVLPLMPCLQRIAVDEDFAYLGGSLLINEPLASRATQLALAALQALPSTHGLVGVDLVLGEAEDGSKDFVIEVNPRCTTSYVGLRAAYDVNLAELVLAVSNGEQVTPPKITRSVEWDATGEVRILD